MKLLKEVLNSIEEQKQIRGDEMSSLNKVQLIGNLGKDPEIKSMNNGKRVANFSVATTESWKDQSGEKQEKTEWHKIVIYNESLIKIVESYVKKGTKIYVEGSIYTRKWTDNGVDKFITEIVIQGYNGTVKLLSSKKDEGNIANNSVTTSLDYGIDDEIPF